MKRHRPRQRNIPTISLVELGKKNRASQAARILLNSNLCQRLFSSVEKQRKKPKQCYSKFRESKAFKSLLKEEFKSTNIPRKRLK